MAKKNYDIDNILKEVDDLRIDESDDNTDGNKKNLAGSQKKSGTKADKKPDFSVTQVIDQYSDKKKGAAAKQSSDSSKETEPESEKVKRLFDDDLRGKKKTDSKMFLDSGDQKTSDKELEQKSESDEFVFHTKEDLVTTDEMKKRKQQRIDEINEALLKADFEAQSDDEMLDLMNPAEKREKVADMLRAGDEKGDKANTLSISEKDLKNIAKEEYVIEYKPHVKETDTPDEILGASAKQQPSRGEMHIGESITDALDKKIAVESEQEQSNAADTADNEEDISDVPDDSEDVEKMREANELAQKRKRKIASFILENPTEEEDEFKPTNDAFEESEDDEEDEDKPIDLDDENIIRERLSRSSKGLFWRLVITGVLFVVTLFIGIVNTANIQELGAIGGVISLRSATENYLYCMLTIGVLSFGSCSSVIANGFSKLFKKRPDGDTLCAVAHTAAIVAMIPYLFRIDYTQLQQSHVYLVVSLALLCFNTLSKLITVKTAQKNFEFISADGAKYFADFCEKGSAEQLAKGAVPGVPITTAVRKTEMLKDFIISTYCEDASDKIAGKASIVTVAAAIIAAVIAFFTNGDIDWENNLSWSFTVLSAVCCLGASLSCSMTVTIPLLFASIKGKKDKFAILGYNAVENFSETNSVLAEASDLFPPTSVVINNICGYDKPSARGEGKVNIDEAIILGASLAYASGSILSDALFNMLDYKKELLKPVSGTVYENNLGVMGWIDRRRVLLGTREHMIAHEISVPSVKKESAANTKNDNVIYLAVGGEVCLLFFVSVKADEVIQEKASKLSEEGVTLLVKSVDGMITAPFVENIFGLYEGSVKVIPFDCHEVFNNCTKFVSSGSGALSVDGTFSSFAEGISAAKGLRAKISIGSIIQIVTAGLGILLAIIFMFAKNYSMFNGLWILIYGVISAAITIGVPFIKRL